MGLVRCELDFLCTYSQTQLHNIKCDMPLFVGGVPAGQASHPQFGGYCQGKVWALSASSRKRS
jgi:hypothetical protein